MFEQRPKVNKDAQKHNLPPDSFELLNAKLANLSTIEPISSILPHHEIAQEIWLDFNAERNTKASVSPEQHSEGIKIHLQDRDNSPWFSFSYALPTEDIKKSRFLGLVINTAGKGTVGFRPCLRFHISETFHDTFSRDLILSSESPEDQFTFIKVDPQLASKAHAAEVLLFFDGDRFELTLNRVENIKI